MKNVKAYDGDSFEFYQTVCVRKQSAELKNRLQVLDPDLQILFDQYDQRFLANTLEQLVAHGYAGQDEDDLKELYNYDSKVLSELRTTLTTTPFGRVVKCQNCTINDVNTFDHLIPQSEFPEFIVHPQNLLCSCGECNSHKGTLWRDHGLRTSLNLYLDILPDLRYLFVNFEISNTTIGTEFYLSNPNGIDPVLFSLLESHYTRLDLLNRFSSSADSVITSFKNTLEPMKLLNNPVLAKSVALESVRLDRLAFGHNYWQSILKFELLNDDDFMIDYE